MKYEKWQENNNNFSDYPNSFTFILFIYIYLKVMTRNVMLLNYS